MKERHFDLTLRVLDNEAFEVDLFENECGDCVQIAGDNEDPQARYVFANDEEDARETLEEYFEKRVQLGYAKPVYIAEPTVELENVIS